MGRGGGGNAPSPANGPSASEGGPERTLTTARPSSASHGPGFAAASRKMTSRRLIDMPRATREALARYGRIQRNEVQRGSSARQCRRLGPQAAGDSKRD